MFEFVFIKILIKHNTLVSDEKLPNLFDNKKRPCVL